MSLTEEEFDVVLWGATGFVGNLIAEHLVDSYGPEELSLALAGRNEEKLARLESRLTDDASEWSDIPMLTGDAFDRESLDGIAERAAVVATTVGPYAKYGNDLVAACVSHGTDYCDLTGEVQWVRRMIDEHHEDARIRGASIVHCCGFDSIPSDLGTYLVQKHTRDTYGTTCERVGGFVTDASGGFSGGTLESMTNALEEAAEDPEVRRTMAHPYALNPAGERDGPDGGMQQRPRWDEDLEAWTAPFVMSTVNEKVVRRTNALLGFSWGRDFRYRESIAAGSGVMGALRAAGVSAATGLFAGAMSVGPLRDLLRATVLPEPGEGPSRKSIEEGSFEVRLLGRGETSSGDPIDVRATIAADRDPGYGATAIMFGETAVALAEGTSDTPLDSGVLTPAAAVGVELAERLRDAGMTIEVDDETRG